MPVAPRISTAGPLNAPILGRSTDSLRPWRRCGRAIRRLVTLTDDIDNVINARTPKEGDATSEETRLFNCYQRLVTCFPEIEEWLAKPENCDRIEAFVHELAEGAHSARANDASSIKGKVVAWLIELDPANLHVSIYNKVGRGFSNETTGMLLCPVDYDWDNAEHKDKVRDWHPDFLVTANAWPRFLYKDGKYNPDNPAEGLFMGAMLVRAFKLIFISPSSAEEGTINSTTELIGAIRRHRSERRTRRSHVAHALKMRSVDPRAIAYTAVQLRFALSDCGSWRRVDQLFDHHEFYHNIVSWFEDTPDLEEQQFVKDLLHWWNRNIFGRESILDYAPQDTENLSVSASFKRLRGGVKAEAPV